MTSTSHDALLAAVRRTLLERRRDLIARRDLDEADSRQLLDEREPDWEDLAANAAAASKLHSLSELERDQLAAVSAAIDRVDAGTWGRCATCGRQIAWPRLRVLPETSHCVRCAHNATHH